MTPKRIQLSRQKGWRMPENTVAVSRGPGRKWGNPFRAGEFYNVAEEENGAVIDRRKCHSAAEAVQMFREYMDYDMSLDLVEALPELRGKNLACWCPLDQPCHADVLLELANEGED